MEEKLDHFAHLFVGKFLGELIEKYLGGVPGASTVDRLRLMNLIAELTATDFGGYQAVLAIHAEGSIEAEKMTIWREHDSAPAVDYAKWLANIKNEKGA